MKLKFIEKGKELEDVDQLSVKYDLSRNFLEENNISTWKNALNVNKFVQGMITNFKI